MSDLTDVVAEYATDLIDLLPVVSLKDFLHWYQLQVDPEFQPPPAKAKRALFAEVTLNLVQAEPANLLQFFDAEPETIPELEANRWPFAMSYDQRRLLTATGHLPVASTRQAHLYGNNVLVPAYSVLEIFRLQLLGADGRKALLTKARQEAKLLPAYQEAQAQRKQQQLEHRQQRANLKTAFWQSVEALRQKVPPAEQPLFQLAFWTQQINQVQKYWQLHTTDKSHAMADYYHLKGLAIAEFLESDDAHIKHGFYRPKQADRFYVSLCTEHFADYQLETDYSIPVYLYYQEHRAAIDACPMCHVSITKDYYALYFTQVKNADFTFSFHTPYPLGNHLYGPVNQYPRVHHQPNVDGDFTFGHAMDRELLRAVGEKNILDEFQQARLAFGEL
ncbi:hypothetical protein [Lacticaseibacillus manihotivorans]|nr:hypothetical protein [Lacticaseibacillus manihotivorans]QFQ92646.1 hypothetical protein LM010_15155 [Lacticaseibacillus manihotivorans]